MTQFSFFEINGQVDTKSTILTNLNNIASSSQSFLTWDPGLGKWRMILNRPINLSTDVARAFDDDSIVGPINVSGSGISDKYNILKVDFTSNDLEGETDETYFAITANERYSNEVDNTLNVSYNLVADQWQAERMGKIELKQSRVDKIITFATDYRAIALKPGDVITVTNDQYGYLNKPWRIQSIEEIDTEEGGIIIGITALEYDVEVYDTTGITVRQRDRNTGIVPAETNMCVFESDNEAISNTVANSLNTDAGRNNLTQEITFGNSSFSIPLLQTESDGFSINEVAAAFGGGTGGGGNIAAISISSSSIPPAGIYTIGANDYTTSGNGNSALMTVTSNGSSVQVNVTSVGYNFIANEVITINSGAIGGGSIDVTVTAITPHKMFRTFQTYRPIKNCFISFEAPQAANVEFFIDGASKTLTFLGLPCTVKVFNRPLNTSTFQGSGSYQLITTRFMEWSSYFTQILIETSSPKEFLVEIQPLVTYDLSASDNPIEVLSASGFLPVGTVDEQTGTYDYATLSVTAYLN
jgi:hypothetical protein